MSNLGWILIAVAAILSGVVIVVSGVAFGVVGAITAVLVLTIIGVCVPYGADNI